jgi:phosphoribosyl 1,2-cyclic phosphodiesterase
VRTNIWGCRGSLATPGAATVRYGGNTTSLEIRTGSGLPVLVDAGTGIRELGRTLAGETRVHLLLTHLHLDHVEGLGFFAPFFDPTCTIRIWGPPQDDASLAERIAEYLSPPFFPLRFEELPARIEFTEVWEESWQLDGLTVRCAPVRHPGNTVGYRFEEEGASLAFIPDNEPALDRDSGFKLAEHANVLLHDAQFTDDEYRDRVGWGHSGLTHFADLVRRAQPGRAIMFHHDPAHTDAQLEEMRQRAEQLAGRPVELAADGLALGATSTAGSV